MKLDLSTTCLRGSQVRFPSAARDFSPTVNFQCRLCYHGVPTPPCAIACINICAHVKDPAVHVRIRWIMETLKHQACTVGWMARLSQLAFPGENNPNFPWEKSYWDNTVVKSKSRGEAGQYCTAQVFRDCSVFEGKEREREL